MASSDWLLGVSHLRAFCYFNNVAVAAKAMLSKGKRAMVLDWVSHGVGKGLTFMHVAS